MLDPSEIPDPSEILDPSEIPDRDAPELEWLLFEQSGVLTWQQAVGCLPPGKVRGLVRTGRWRSLVHGVLLASNGRLNRRQQLWTAALAAGPGALLAGATAASICGVRGLPEAPIWVLIPASRHRGQRTTQLPVDMPPVVVRRASILPVEHRLPGRPPRTSTPRSIVDAASWAGSERAARAIIAKACQQRRVSPEELAGTVELLPRLRRRALIREAIRDVAGGATTLSELDLVKLCQRYGLPRPKLQQRRRDATGRLRYLDAYWPQWRLHVEVDGTHHMDADQWEADMQRQNDVWIRGDRVLRFSGHQVRRRPALVADQIRRALLAAGWTP